MQRCILTCKVLFVGVLLASLGGCSSKVTGSTPGERIASINKLADNKPWGAGKAIADAINGETDPSVREAALAAISNFPDSAYRPEVEKAAKDPSMIVRVAAVRTLTVYKDDQAIGMLAQIIQTDPNSEVRSMACVSMAQIDKPMVVYYLMDVAENGKENASRAVAAQMLLGMLGLHMDPSMVNPEDQAMWLNVIETIKAWPYIQHCYKEIDKPLVRHPEHLLKPAGDNH